MNVIDGRGKHKKALSEKNKAKVKRWFNDNQGSTITECCKGTGLTYMTVKGHIMALKLDEQREDKKWNTN